MTYRGVIYSYFIMGAMALNNVFIGYRIFDVISFDRIIELMLFIILLPVLWRDFRFHNGYRRVMLIFVGMLFFIFLHIYLDLMQNFYYANGFDVFRDLVRSIYFIILLSLVFYAVLRSNNSINFYLTLIFLVVLFGLFQHPLTPFTDLSNEIRMSYFKVNMTPEEYNHATREIKQWGFYPRSTGPYGYPIAYSYVLLSALIVTSYQYLLKRKEIYFYLAILIYVVSFMTETRSLAISATLIFLYLLFNKNKILLGLLMSFALIGLIIVPDTNLFEARLFDKLEYSRVNALAGGLLTILQEPFLPTEATYVKNFYYSCSLFGMENCGDLISSHNGFINIAENMTIFGLMLYLFLIGLLFYYAFQLSRPLKGLFVVSIIGYIIQSFFHNNTMFISEYSFIVPISLLINEVIKVQRAKKDKIVMSVS